jgi:hypothetical protein
MMMIGVMIGTIMPAQLHLLHIMPTQNHHAATHCGHVVQNDQPAHAIAQQ